MTHSQIKEIVSEFSFWFFCTFDIENISAEEIDIAAMRLYISNDLSLDICEQVVSIFIEFGDDDMGIIEAEFAILDWVTEGEEYAE